MVGLKMYSAVLQLDSNKLEYSYFSESDFFNFHEKQAKILSLLSLKEFNHTSFHLRYIYISRKFKSLKNLDFQCMRFYILGKLAPNCSLYVGLKYYD